MIFYKKGFQGLKCSHFMRAAHRVAILFLVIANSFCYAKETPATLNARDLKNVEDAKSFLVGTWIHSDGVSILTKWIIKKDGTMEVIGEPLDSSGFTYKVITGNYIDTGDVYYGMSLIFPNGGPHVGRVFIQENGKLAWKIPAYWDYSRSKQKPAEIKYFFRSKER